MLQERNLTRWIEDEGETPEDYLRFLRVECQYAAAGYLPGERQWWAIYPLMYSVAIIKGRIYDRIGIDGRWCYETMDQAVLALAAWLASGGEGEPQGWHRDPMSGRRRWGGEARLEYYEP
jgi:hypothetical protein